MSLLPEERVAARFLQAREWGDPSKILSEYMLVLGLFRQSVEEQRNKSPNPYILGRAWMSLIYAGRKLSEWALQTRAIPPGQEKPLELTARVFGSAKRTPKNVIVWADKNKAWLDFLIEASKWPDRSVAEEGGVGQIVVVGPFKVHNTIGADEKKFATIQDLVQKAVTILNTTRDFKKVLYGEVFIVGQIQQAKTIAWYTLKEDEVYLRALARWGIDDLQNLLHELGHRYWYKFMTTAQKQSISRLYYELRRSSGAKVEMPKVGEPFPIPVRGQKGPPPIVSGYHGSNIVLSTGGMVSSTQVYRILADKQISAKFPTRYSMKTVEEFFAECFAFYALKKLSPELHDRFDAALPIG